MRRDEPQPCAHCNGTGRIDPPPETMDERRMRLLLEAVEELVDFCWPGYGWRGETNMRGCLKPIVAVRDAARAVAAARDRAAQP